MTRWIRGWGLAVFVLLVAMLAGGAMLYADRLVKSAVESVGSSANGAKVELQSASLSFNPLGFALTDLQVTDAHAPLRNVVQIQRIKFALDGYALLRRKVVVTDLNAEGVRTNTPRASSGALPQVPAPAPEVKKTGPLDSFSFPQVDFPDVKQFMADNELASTQLAGQLHHELDQARQHWNTRLAGLPDGAALKDYAARIQQARPNRTGNALQDAQEIAASIQRLQALRDAIGKDVEYINTAGQAWDADWATWAQHAKELLAAPGADIDFLKGKYSLDTKGFANASHALFGGQIAQWTDTGLYWYDKAKPLLADRRVEQAPQRVRGKGIDVRFAERDQLPEFLIRSAKLSLEVPAGVLRGEIRNITNDQVTLGHPLTFNFFAEKMPGIQDLELEGVFNHVAPGVAVDSTRLKAHGMTIRRFDVLRQPRFPLVLSDATVDLDATVQLKNGVLQGDLSAGFKTVKLGSDVKNPSGELEKILVTTLADVRRFTLKAHLQGTLQSYDVKLHSDLDTRLRDAMNKQFRARVDTFVAQLKTQLDAKAQQARRELDTKFSDLKGIGGAIDQRRKQADDIQQNAEQELRAAADKAGPPVDAQKQLAKDKSKQVTDKLKVRLPDRLR